MPQLKNEGQLFNQSCINGNASNFDEEDVKENEKLFQEHENDFEQPQETALMKAKKWLLENSKSIPMSQKKDRPSSLKKESHNIETYNKAIQDLEIYMKTHPEIDWTKNQNNKSY